MFEGHDKLWVIHIGMDDKVALRARDEGFVCIRWEKLGDLKQYDTRGAIKEAMRKAWPEWTEKRISGGHGQVFRFAHEMKIGDALVFPIKSTRQIAIGRVASDYIYASDDPGLVSALHPNVRKVEWLDIVPRTVFSQSALHSFGSLSTLSSSDDYLEEVIGVLSGKTAVDEIETPKSDVGTDDGDDEGESSALFETAVQETEDYLLKAWHRTGTEFEHVVAAVLEAIGYTANVTTASSDHGVDVVAHPDPLGLEQPFIKVQVKSGSTTSGEPDVNQLVGALSETEKGIFVSLGGFTSQAKSKARNSARITLIDAAQFVSLFLSHYDKLAPEWQAKFPLARVYVPRL